MSNTQLVVESSEDAADLARRMTDSLDALVALLDRETGLLRSGNISEIEALQAEKAALTAAYMGELQLYRSHRDLIHQAAGPELTQVAARQDTFQTSVAANQGALEAAHGVSMALVQRIATSAAAHAGQPNTYGKDGQLARGRRAGVPAIAIDEAL